MANLLKADCGFDPSFAIEAALGSEQSGLAFKSVTKTQLEAVGGFDVKDLTNAIYTAPADASSNLIIARIKNAVPGKVYTLLVKNAVATSIGATFTGAKSEKVEYGVTISGDAPPTATVAAVTIANADIVAYKFFSDGTNLYVSRQLYA